MPIWNVIPVSNQPELVLTEWSIILVNQTDWHFVGYAPANAEGRVSSKVDEFDLERRVGRTKSGRLYRLEGAPGDNPDARYTFNLWCSYNPVEEFEEITSKVLSGELAKT